jgi:phosphonate transport system permease protein
MVAHRPVEGRRIDSFGGRIRGIDSRAILTLILVAAFLWSLTSIAWDRSLMHAGGVDAIQRIATAAIRPKLSLDVLQAGIVASWRTLAYASAGVSLAVLLALPLGVLASGVLSYGRIRRLSSIAFFRGCLASLRAIHELVWAWLILAAIGLSPMTAVLALALPYAGILGRIFADMLNNVPDAPLKALRAAGASEWQVLLYGRFPWVMSSMVSYAMYRYECGIRSAAIMSFVGLGGLGYQIQISLEDLNYNEVWTFVYFLVVLVVLFELASGVIRRSLTS